MSEFTLQIDGMHCGSCVRRASQALAAVEGVDRQRSARGRGAPDLGRGARARRCGDCRPRQGRLHRASGTVSGAARNRIAHASRAGDDVCLLPASRGRSAARDRRRRIGACRSDGPSRQRGLRSGDGRARATGRGDSRRGLRRRASARRAILQPARTIASARPSPRAKPGSRSPPAQRPCCWPCRWARKWARWIMR